MYSEKTSQVLQYQGYIYESDYIVIKSRNDIKLDWYSADPQPTESEVATIAVSQAFLDWEATHGGDEVLTRRRIAKEKIAEISAEQMRHRAAFIELVKELNRHANKINAILDAIDNATSLANLQNTVQAIADYPQRTPAQLNALIEAAIDAGEAD